MLRKFYAKIAVALLALELVSWLGYNYEQFRNISLIVIVVLILVISIKKLEYGVYAIIAELVVGSHGYMLSIPIGSFNLSLRLALFLVVMLAWLIDVARSKKIYFFHSQFWKWYVALITFLIIGVLVGYLMGNDLSNIFFDWNGYLFIGLIFPFTQAIRHREQILKIIMVVFAGITILAMQTLLILFLFSHQTSFQHYLPALYQWIRDFRIGEITLKDNGFYRIFFQSHIYVIYALLLSLSFLLKKFRWEYFIFLEISITLIFLSYSRSFWVAILITLCGLALFLIVKYRISLKKVSLLYASMLLLFCVGYLLVLGVVNVSLPGGSGSGVGATSLLTERTQDPTAEAGGGSRMALIKPLLEKNLEHPLLGSGFGTTVTYATQDQRALENNPDGMYTTYAFEWGYLDMWLKLGVAGTAVYGILILLLIVRGYEIATTESLADRNIVFGIVFGLIALVVIHALTPYLNHPLGIGWLLFTTVIIDYYGKQQTTTS
ncbi:MAG: O-antigen ligase family protein [bacterium]|nr:O-antigen ligase family protein [bacterium]